MRFHTSNLPVGDRLFLVPECYRIERRRNPNRTDFPENYLARTRLLSTIDRCFLPARGRFKLCEDGITGGEPDDVQDALDGSRNLANSVTVEVGEFPSPRSWQVLIVILKLGRKSYPYAPRTGRKLRRDAA